METKSNTGCSVPDLTKQEKSHQRQKPIFTQDYLELASRCASPRSFSPRNEGATGEAHDGLDTVLVELREIHRAKALLANSFNRLAQSIESREVKIQEVAMQVQSQMATLAGKFAASDGPLRQLQEEMVKNRIALGAQGEKIDQLKADFNDSLTMRLAEALSCFCEDVRPVVKQEEFASFFLPLIDDLAGRFGLEVFVPSPEEKFDPKTMVPSRDSQQGDPEKMCVREVLRPGMKTCRDLLVRACVALKVEQQKDHNLSCFDGFGQQHSPWPE